MILVVGSVCALVVFVVAFACDTWTAWKEGR